MANNDVVVFGGYPLTSENSKFYDPVTATWTLTNGVAVITGPLTGLADGSAFIAGGGFTHYKSRAAMPLSVPASPRSFPTAAAPARQRATRGRAGGR